MNPLVHIVDDDSSVRRSLSRLLDAYGYNIQSHDSAQSFLLQLDPNTPGCLILDIRMPEMTGMELQEELKLRHSPLPIIFITGHGDIPLSVRAMKEGAVDFLSKPFNNDDLIRAVNQALAKAKTLFTESNEQRDIQIRYDQLTQRERQVLGSVANGLLNKQIAGQLGIAEKTVKVHRASGLHKMGITNVPSLVKALAKIGLV